MAVLSITPTDVSTNPGINVVPNTTTSGGTTASPTGLFSGMNVIVGDLRHFMFRVLEVIGGGIMILFAMNEMIKGTPAGTAVNTVKKVVK